MFKRHDVGNMLEFTCHTCDIPTLDNLDFLVGAPLRALKIVNSSLSKIKDGIFRQGTNGAKFNLTLVSTEERKSPSFNLYTENPLLNDQYPPNHYQLLNPNE